MYYNTGVVYNTQFAACKRLDTFKKFALTTVFSDQVELAGLAAKHVWNQGNDFSRVKDADVPQVAKDTLRKFDDHLGKLKIYKNRQINSFTQDMNYLTKIKYSY